MTTREILEQEFNDKFGKLFTKEQLENLELKNAYPQNEEIKSYIFEQMIPKVLEEMLLPNARHENEVILNKNLINTYIKQNAKEKFGIDL